MNVTCARESILGLWKEIWPLLEEDEAEAGGRLDAPLAPMCEAYEALERAGALRCYMMRVNGRLAGYSIMGVSPAMHNRDALFATQDALFVLPEFRRYSLNLLRYADAELALECVDAIKRGARLTAPGLGKILVRLDYKATDVVYLRKLHHG